MNARPAGRWPVTRSTACLIAAAIVVGAVAAKVPDLRGGLFLLSLLGAAVGLVLFDHQRRR